MPSNTPRTKYNDINLRNLISKEDPTLYKGDIDKMIMVLRRNNLLK